jgi:hypothetical protein
LNLPPLSTPFLPLLGGRQDSGKLINIDAHLKTFYEKAKEGSQMASKSLNIDQVKFESPGEYKIVVQGVLGESWSDRLAGMRIAVTESGHGHQKTTLTGHLRDQTQLSGVLSTLHELHLPILLVTHTMVKKEGKNDQTDY